jgi:surface protein
MKLNLDTQSLVKLVLFVCLVSILVYLFVFQPSISSVKLVQDKRKSIETTFDEDSGPECKPNVGQFCPGGFPCPQTGKCPGCKEVLTKVCGDDKYLGPDQCTECIKNNRNELETAGCTPKSIDDAKKVWCDLGPDCIGGQLCPGGFPCPPNGMCPGCEKVLTKVCGYKKNIDPDDCNDCLLNHEDDISNAGCTMSRSEKWCTLPPSPQPKTCKEKQNKWFDNTIPGTFLIYYVTALTNLKGEPEEVKEFIQCVNNKNFLKNMGWTNLSKMFENVDFAQFPELDISKWDTSSVTDMSYMFNSALNIPDISGWNVRSVTDMSGMFHNAQYFDKDISGWDVSSVTDMNSMFLYAYSFNQSLGMWDVSSVTNMSNMFDQAYKFNGDIGGWDVSSVTDMSNMFDSANSFNQDIGGWDVSSVTDMTSMFEGAVTFNQDISKWNVKNVTKHWNIFNGAISISKKNQPNFNVKYLV